MGALGGPHFSLGVRTPGPRRTASGSIIDTV